MRSKDLPKMLGNCVAILEEELDLSLDSDLTSSDKEKGLRVLLEDTFKIPGNERSPSQVSKSTVPPVLSIAMVHAKMASCWFPPTIGQTQKSALL